MQHIDQALTLILVALFLFGTAISAIAPAPIRDSYARWGYPKGFWYVTSAVELVTSALLIFSSTRLFGAVLGMVVLASALITLLRSHEFLHAVAPAFFLALVTTLAWRLFWA